MADSVHFSILNNAVAPGARRDTARPVMLIGFQAQANLGLGYLASYLRESGYRVVVLDFEAPEAGILEAVRDSNPFLIGFSLIFQFYVDRFGALMRYLRRHGVDCHFTVGGHFPSLSYQHALQLLPEADSVVRFEGEYTLLELADVLGAGREWRGIEGIAYRQDGAAAATRPRRLIENLDELPYPERKFETTPILGQITMPILASRGCARTCSFCSIHMFYRAAPGKVVRTRKPAEVVREMSLLYQRDRVTIFLFQDDDFPLFGPVWRRWAREFVAEMHASGLAGRVLWKINCRADAVDADLFAAMRDAGLYFVYMGLESGTEEGLKTLHKQITAEQNLRAVEILKSLGLMFQFGFMLFEPSSTFDSIRENLRFLRAIVGDGCVAATFCRMIPYDGTPIKDALERAGRLKGDILHPDYDFLDPRLSDFYGALTHVVDLTGWIHGYRSLSPYLNFAWSEVAVIERLFPPLPDLAAYKEKLRQITMASNDVLFQVVEDVAAVYAEGRPNPWSNEALEARRLRFHEALLDERDGFVYRNQAAMLRALNREDLAAAVCA